MNDISPEPTPDATPDGPSNPTGADLVQTVTRIERSIKDRRESDQTFINWWLYVLLVNPVTFGIYGIVLYFKRINRIDRFSTRKQAYYNAVIDWTERRAQQAGKEPDVHHMLEDMRSEVQAAYRDNLKQIKAGLSFLLTIVTLGIYGFWVLHKLNKYWWQAMVVEQEFDDKLSQAWSALGLTKYPVTFSLDQSKRRSYGLYLLLGFVTFGIWFYVWDYKIHTDPEAIYPEFHSVEDTVLQTVRAH